MKRPRTQTDAQTDAQGGFLTDDRAIAACVLWACGHFDTAAIAELLGVREDAIARTLHMARDGARERRIS